MLPAIRPATSISTHIIRKSLPLRRILNDRIVRTDGTVMNLRIGIRTGVPIDQLGSVIVLYRYDLGGGDM